MNTAHVLASLLTAGLFTLAAAARRLNPVLAWAGLALVTAALVGMKFLIATT